MMGERQVRQEALFYGFNLDDHVPADHLLRSIDRFVEMSGIRQHLEPFYSTIGRPSTDPELMIRMLLMGYCCGIRSERRLCDEVHLNLAYRWFCRLGLDGQVPDHSTFSKNRHGRFRDSDLLQRLFEATVQRCMAEGRVGRVTLPQGKATRHLDARGGRHGLDGIRKDGAGAWMPVPFAYTPRRVEIGAALDMDVEIYRWMAEQYGIAPSPTMLLLMESATARAVPAPCRLLARLRGSGSSKLSGHRPPQCGGARRRQSATRGLRKQGQRPNTPEVVLGWQLLHCALIGMPIVRNNPLPGQSGGNAQRGDFAIDRGGGLPALRIEMCGMLDPSGDAVTADGLKYLDRRPDRLRGYAQAGLPPPLVVTCGELAGAARITVVPFRAVADQLYQLATGRRATPASDEQVRDAVTKAAASAGAAGYPLRFILSEWRHVVDAWQLDGIAAYASVPRLGRKSRMSAGQRERLWPVFAATRASLAKRGLLTRPEIFGAATAHYAGRDRKLFAHVVVDEAQDLGVPELRFLAAVAPAGPDALFFAGDIGRRIFQQPFSWRELDVDIRGRASTLTVNYRTSHQIRRMADRLLPGEIKDADGPGAARDRTVSIFDGPLPQVQRLPDAAAEIAAVSSWLKQIIAAGTLPAEIGIFVRSRAQLDRARAALAGAGAATLELSDRDQAASPSARCTWPRGWSSKLSP